MVKSSRFCISVLAIAAMVLGACAADPGNSATDLFDTGRPLPDAGDPDIGSGTPDSGAATDTDLPDIPVTGREQLLPYSDVDVRMTYNSAIDIQVQYINAQSEPIEGAMIEFDYDEVRASGSSLRALTARTDSEGIATVQLTAATSDADFEISASVRGNEEIDGVTFFVTVRAKEASDYTITSVYGDDRPFDITSVEYSIFRQALDCDDIEGDPLDADFYSDLPPAYEIFSTTNPFDPYPYENELLDEPVTAVIAVAEIATGQVVGWSCNSGPFRTSDGSEIDPLDVGLGDSVNIDLFINEIYPAMAGVYEVENEFDLIELIPDSVEGPVRYIGSFFDSPGGTIYQILIDTGVIDEGDIPSFFVDGFVGLVDELLFEFLPPEVTNVFVNGTDIYDALQNIRMVGRLKVFEDPDGTGTLGACNELVIDQIVVDIDLIDEADRVLNLRARGYQAIYGQFTGFVSIGLDRRGDPVYYLNIDPFELDLNYGDILLFVLEDLIFPAFFGPDVDSLESFVATIIDCEAIAAEIWSGFEPLCDAALDAAADGIRDGLSGATVSVGSFYRLATPVEGTTAPDDVEILEEGMEWGPCGTTLDSDVNNFEVVELGGAGPDRCIWDARFLDGPADPVGEAVSAAFFGFRTGSISGRETCGDGE